MAEFWQQLIALTVTPALIVGAVAWLSRRLINQAFTRELERFKSELESKNFEHREKFSLIYQRRAEIICGLYSLLVKAKRLVGDLVAPFQRGGQSLPEKKQKVADAYNEAASFFYENRPFFTKETVDKVDKLLDTLSSALIDFDTAQIGEDYKPDDTGLWMQSYKSVRDDIPPILDALESEFREILGFIEGSP